MCPLLIHVQVFCMGNDCKVYWYMLFLASFIWPWPFVTFVIFDGLVLCSISNTCRSVIYFLYNDICPCPQFHDSVFFPLFLRYMYYIWQCIIRKRSTTCLYIVYTFVHVYVVLIWRFLFEGYNVYLIFPLFIWFIGHIYICWLKVSFLLCVLNEKKLVD